MLTISPELQKQIEYNARREGIAPDEWLETAVHERAAFIANKRLWEVEEKADIREAFIEKGKQYTDTDMVQELERRRILHLEQNGGNYKIEVVPVPDDLTPEELEELKQAITESEEEERLGIHHTTEDMLAHVAKAITEYKNHN